MRSRLIGWLLLASMACAGCSGMRGPARWFGSQATAQFAPDTQQGVSVVDSAEMASFFAHASGFYSRLALRRFNDRTTFLDPKLGIYFRTESAYADYYAFVTGHLRLAHFKRLRPTSVEIAEVRSEGPGKAVVVVKMTGENSRPLRWNDVHLTREDRWERIEERWWIVPGRI